MALSTSDFTTRLLLDAGIGPGMRVLELGCGSGDVSRLLAELVEQDGAVVTLDGIPAALPASLGLFDAVVGCRVLAYQAEPVTALRRLAKPLLPGGVMVFQEHDNSLVPASLEPFPLHRRAQRWLQRLIAEESADPHIGFNLHKLLTQAGLQVESLRAECVLQTPNSPYILGDIIGTCLPRLIEHGIATARQVGIGTLQARLDAERAGSQGIYIGDMAFGIWARKR